MSTPERSDSLLVPFPLRPARWPSRGRVLAVIGSVVNTAALDLAMLLVEEEWSCLDILQVIEVPPALPLGAYGRLLSAKGCGSALAEACSQCGPTVGDASVLLCRSMAPALLAEVAARGSGDLVLGTPTGSWWSRRRGRRAIAHLQARACCRVYVVHAAQANGVEAQLATG